MSGQGYSSSYPPTYNLSSSKRSRARPRKNPHPLTTRSLPQLHHSGSGTFPSSRHRVSPASSAQSAGRRASKSPKSKSPSQSRGAAAADQLVPLDFSVRRSNKRSSIVAFGRNESDAENMAAAALAIATVDDAAAQMLYEQSQAEVTFSDQLRAQLQVYFRLQQQQLQQQKQSESDQCTTPKKQRQDSSNEDDAQWPELSSVASPPTSFMAAAKEHRPARKRNIASSVQVPIGRGRSFAVARRRSNANNQAAMGRVQSRPCSVNNSLSGDGSSASACECSRQQIFVNYQLFIDEHFRRSLGTKKYRELFPSTKSSRNPSSSSTDDEDDEPLEVTLD